MQLRRATYYRIAEHLSADHLFERSEIDVRTFRGGA